MTQAYPPQASLPPITLQWPNERKPKSIIKKDAQKRYQEALKRMEFQMPMNAMSSGPSLAPASTVSTIQTPSLGGASSVTDTSSIYSLPVRAVPTGMPTRFTIPSGVTPVFNQREAHEPDEYVLIFNRANGAPRVHYLMVDRHRRGRLLPKVNYVTMTKVKDVCSYRVVNLDNFLYILGGRNIESGNCISYCYRYDARNNQWIRISNLIRARCRFTANALDGFIYVVGELSGQIRLLWQ